MVVVVVVERCVVRGRWPMGVICGPWSMGGYLWSIADGGLFMVDGRWGVICGRWPMGGYLWSMADGGGGVFVVVGSLGFVGGIQVVCGCGGLFLVVV